MSGARFTIGQRLVCVMAVTLRLVTGLAAAGVVLVRRHAATHCEPVAACDRTAVLGRCRRSGGCRQRVLRLSEAVRRLPKVSGYRGTNVEAVIALKPDLVVAWPGGNRAADLAALRRLGVRVYESELDTLTGILAEVRQFSEWATDDESPPRDTSKPATPRRRFFRYSAATARPDGFACSTNWAPGDCLRCRIAMRWAKRWPFAAPRTMFGRLQLPAPEVSSEAVLAAKPEAVLVADPASLVAVRERWTSARLFDTRSADVRVLAVDGARLHRPTLRTFAAVQALCESIDRVRHTLR